MKKVLKLIVIIYILLSLFYVSNATTYFVTGDGIRVRSSKENTDTNIIGKLEYGTKVEVVDDTGSWYKIKYKDGYAYMTYRYLSKETRETHSMATLKKSASLKKSESSSSKTICSIPKGAAVKVFSLTSKYAYVEYNEKYGYVSKSYLNVVTNNKELAEGIYTVTYSYSNSSRKKNIEKAVKALNHCTIKPGKTISFIDVVGTSGYLNVPEFKNEKSVYGGGLSEVATSLYLAIREAQRNGCYISVKSQNRHSEKTPYAKLGEEAMIDLKNNTDLVFKNKTNKTIKIYANVSGDNVSFVISTVQ